MDFYILNYKSIIAEYIKLENPGKDLDDRGYYASWFQFLDDNPIEITISEKGGLEYPDYLIQDDVSLISEKFKNILDELKVKYIFFKPIFLFDEYEKTKKKYYLIVPTRIDCLDYNNSDYDEDSEYSEKIKIDSSQIGDIDIFKLKGLGNNEIILTEKVWKILDKAKLEGVYFKKL